MPLIDWITDHFNAVMSLTKENSPMSAVVGYALIINLTTAPLLTIIFYGTTLDNVVYRYFPDKAYKYLWSILSILTCWVMIVAEEAYSIYEKHKQNEVMRKMIKRPTIFSMVSKTLKLGPGFKN